MQVERVDPKNIELIRKVCILLQSPNSGCKKFIARRHISI